MRIVMLGAGGRLGQVLRPRWPGDAVWTTRAQVDINAQQALRRALDGADFVFCLAGVTRGSAAQMTENCTLARKVLDAAHGSHVFLFSSAAIYGDLPGPRVETGPNSTLSDYGRSKKQMETMAAAHANPSTALRLGNVAGADAVLGAWRPGFRLDQLPDGLTPARSYIGPTKLAKVLWDLTQAKDLPTVLNVAAPGMVRMGDLLDAAGLPWEPKPATDQTLAAVHLDTSRLERFTYFQAADGTAQGIVDDWRKDWGR